MIDTEGRHPATAQIARFFDADHLSREDMRTVSQACCDLAETMLEHLDDGPELTAGLRKLLEAKDCFVRAVL
ncbi:hypothetical protein ACWEVP_31775 [Amycolatopsis sp. NPDC003865]